MLAMKTTRRQSDVWKGSDTYTRSGGLDCTASRDTVRPEFGYEADINNIMKHFGVGRFTTAQPNFTSTDWGVDLQQAMHTIVHAHEAHAKLPKELRDKYPTYADLVKAAETGELEKEWAAIQAAQRKARQDEKISEALSIEKARDDAKTEERARAAAERARRGDIQEPK